jgi:hypothetical protein
MAGRSVRARLKTFASSSNGIKAALSSFADGYLSDRQCARLHALIVPVLRPEKRPHLRLVAGTLPGPGAVNLLAVVDAPRRLVVIVRFCPALLNIPRQSRTEAPAGTPAPLPAPGTALPQVPQATVSAPVPLPPSNTRGDGLDDYVADVVIPRFRRLEL